MLLSEEDYSGIMETLYLVSAPGMREKIMDGIATPLEDCVDETAVSGKCTRSFTPKPPQRTCQN